MDLIVGAGISGLGYAASTPNDYQLIERSNDIGGYCKTFYNGEYVWDCAGHFFHFQHPELRDFVMSNIPDEEVIQVRKQTQIYYKGRLIDYPFQMNIHQLEQQEFIDCLYDLFNIPEEADSPASTFKQMLYAKFGKSIAEKFLIPYNGKLYATDLDKLDVDAMGRFFPYANKEQIIRNFRNPSSQSYNATFLHPLRGCIRIIDSVASHVDMKRVTLGEELIAIDMKQHTAQTTRRMLTYDRLISSIPFPQLLSLCSVNYDPAIYSCNKVLVFNLGFDKKGPERQNNWIYYPDPSLVFYRVGFYDNILQQDRMSLYVEIGFGQGDQVPPADTLLERVLDDLRKIGVLTDQRLEAYNTVLMDPAYVHITHQSETDKAEKMALLSNNDIYSIGRYGAWKYCSLEDNLHDAIQLAEKLSQQKDSLHL
ncbi:MAG: NAD(P)-binding protein [Bacteroidales bacterium]|nr:NAD(P)-binding protein [Bacteroidales bacterium]